MENRQIADRLDAFAALLDLAEANPYTARAYRRAAETIRGAPVPVDDLVRSGRVRELRGIGPGIEARLRELVESGQIAELAELEQELTPELIGLGRKTGTVGMGQIVRAEKYVIKHRLGGVISQSFVATEQAIGSAAVMSLRGAYLAASAGHVTVLAGSGDSGATGFGSDQERYYTHRVTSWPASDPLVTAVGGTRLNLDASGNRNSADTVWNDTYSRTANQLVNGSNGPNPLGTGGGKSVLFARPSYQSKVRGITGVHRGLPDVSMSAACSGAVTPIHFPVRPRPAVSLAGMGRRTLSMRGTAAAMASRISA